MTATAPATPPSPPDVPPFRYTATLANEIEAKWQDRWAEQHTFYAPNPVGPLSDGFVPDAPKTYLLDMFPYPSGSGLHVGHPLGFIGTDVLGRYLRMTGGNVLHAMGYDAFGLPAEQYAVRTGTHPRVTTEANIERYRAQMRRLGLAHDPRRSVATSEVEFYRWTQWIFLQLFNSWYDEKADRARPIDDLVGEFVSAERPVPAGHGSTDWSELTPVEQQRILADHRLAYVAKAPVNWCPGLGTVLSNEEVTSDNRSEIGNFPVFRRDLRQWMMRITAYADRLLADLDRLDWPDSVKAMQRNWIGRSVGAQVCFPVVSHHSEGFVEVYTTRPDTIFGATYLVLAPEHPLVGSLVDLDWPAGTDPRWTGGYDTPAEAVDAYRTASAQKSDLDRQENKEKTGVFTGAFARNPANGADLPVFIADYVLMGYGTGAIMGVAGQDTRDWEFATAFGLPIVRTVQPPEDWPDEAYTGDGPAINSAGDGVDLNGLSIADAKSRTIEWLQRTAIGEPRQQYKLRDWLFSRQRYWGEPFPIVYSTEPGAEDVAIPLPESMLPLPLPEMADYAPKTFDPMDADSQPEPPLGRTEWATVELDLGDGRKTYRRELNVMPQWAGSCWYELRYLDPTNDKRFVDPELEHYWMGPRDNGPGRPKDPGGVDLYVGGVEHAVLHLLYSRFWHKVLHDLGQVESEEPYRRLFNQGYIQAYAYTDPRGFYVPAEDVREVVGGYDYQGEPVRREYGKMGKSLNNVVTPDEMCARYGADTFRMYEMGMGPLDMSRPWQTRDVVGAQRYLQRLWRSIVDESTGAVTVTDVPADEPTRAVLNRTIDGVRGDFRSMQYNTAIAKLYVLLNHVTKADAPTPREVADALVLMTAPLAPHIAQELWERLGPRSSLARGPFPDADSAYLVDETVEYPVQIAGKIRSRVTAAADASAETVEQAALADPKVVEVLAGRTPRKVVVVPGRMVSIVV